MEIQESIERIVEAKDRLGLMFYEHFLRHYPQVQQYFQTVELQRQSNLLISALMIAERHATHPSRTTEMYLRHLGTRHHDSKISRNVYGVWIQAMLETMQEFHGQDWTPELENQWRQALEGAVQLMLLGYEERMLV